MFWLSAEGWGVDVGVNASVDGGKTNLTQKKKASWQYHGAFGLAHYKLMRVLPALV